MMTYYLADLAVAVRDLLAFIGLCCVAAWLLKTTWPAAYCYLNGHDGSPTPEEAGPGGMAQTASEDLNHTFSLPDCTELHLNCTPPKPHTLPSVRFPVESRGRKRKGVSTFQDL